MRWLVSGVLFIVALASLAVWGNYRFNQSMAVRFVDDALFMAASEIHSELRRNPGMNDDNLADRVFRLHHEASVSPVWLDHTGQPVDAWGTPFHTTMGPGTPPRWVRCESAGPDREFGTHDDISRSSK